jgi:hypothetical protein
VLGCRVKAEGLSQARSVPHTGSGKGDWGSGPSCVALGRAGPMQSSYRAKQNGHWVASEEKWNGSCTREMKRKH